MAGTKRFQRSLTLLTMVVMFFLAPLAHASEVDRLLDLLVRKHLVTEEEAATLRAEVAKEKEQGSNPASDKQEMPAPPRGSESLADKPHETAKTGFPVLTSLPFRLSGFIQTRWSEGPGKPNTLEIPRARLRLRGNLTDKLGYYVQVDGAKSPILLDADLDYRYRPYATLRIGQFKIPFSQESLFPDSGWLAIERSVVGSNLDPDRDNGSQGRDIGVQLSGTFSGWKRRPLVDYAVGLFNGAGINKTDDNNRKDVAARVAVHPVAGLTFTGDYFNGAIGAKKLPKERMDVEFAYLRKPFSAYGEYIWGHDDAVRKNGWYALFAYRFNPKWEGVVRLDNYDPNLHGRNTQTTAYLVGLNWYLNRWVKWQTDYGVQDQENRAHLAQVFLTQVQFMFQLSGKKGDIGE
jgi:hypothetical protein